jgi:hypothetical protein
LLGDQNLSFLDTERLSCSGRQVELHTHSLDRYGRTLAVVSVDGIDANLDQVRSGFAWVYEKYIGTAPVDIQASYHVVQTVAQQEGSDVSDGTLLGFRTVLAEEQENQNLVDFSAHGSRPLYPLPSCLLQEGATGTVKVANSTIDCPQRALSLLRRMCVPASASCMLVMSSPRRPCRSFPGLDSHAFGYSLI